MKTSSVRCGMMNASALRLDAPYYLNEAVAYYSGLKKCPYELTTVGNVCERVFFGNIFSRNFVADEQHGVSYLRASEIRKADLRDGDLFLAKRQAEKLGYLRLQKGWILVTCSGSLGCCVYADSRFNGLLGTHDLIRIVPLSGGKLAAEVLFAFLASKYGYATLTHSQYGSVILHTNPEQVRTIKLPILPKAKQKTIQNLIEESVRLREEGECAINKAMCIFDDQLLSRRLPRICRVDVSRIGDIKKYGIRFDSQFVIGNKLFKEQFGKERVTFKPLSDFAKEIYIGGRDKRIYTQTGVTFLTTSATLQANPAMSARTISKRNPGLDTLIVRKDNILVSRSGTVDTVGHVAIVGADIADVAVSDDAIRVVVDDEKISPYYLYCYLRTKVAKSNMEHLAFGSAILHVNEPLVGELMIPVLDKKLRNEITMLGRTYRECFALAALKENEAIDAVEAEIESWQGV